MIYFLALLPATALTIAGYFVLFLSARAEGSLRTFGRYLGFWAFTLAGLVILGAIFAAAHHGHRAPAFGTHGMYRHLHGPWSGEARPGEWRGPPPAEMPAEGSGAPGAPPQTPPPPGGSADSAKPAQH
jgi:hypothetical protein